MGALVGHIATLERPIASYVHKYRTLSPFPVHQHFSEARFTDYYVDDEGEPSWRLNVVGMIGPIEGDRCSRPFQIS
jgi:hypothetical protein